MGTWGGGLFDDDTARDVRDRYVGMLAEGHAGPAATDQMLVQWKTTIDDDDEGPVFWLALAATQHKLGRLEPRVKEKALQVLNEERGLTRWREAGPRAMKRRQASLAKVWEQILSPQPPEKRVAPRFRDVCLGRSASLSATA